MLDYILSLPRSIKRFISITIDVFLIIFSYFLALGVRLELGEELKLTQNWYIILLVGCISILFFMRLGLYRAIIRFVTIKFTQVAILASILSTATLLAVVFIFQFNLPRSIPFLYFIFISIFITYTRFLWRMLLSHNKDSRTKVLIYGAGYSGRQLLTALNQGSHYSVVGFIDDNKALHKTILHGITVYSSKSLGQLIDNKNIKKILLAMPSARQSQRKAIINRISKYKCEVLTIPGMEDIVSGKAHLTSLNQVSISDLLGRDPVTPIESLLKQDIENKIVMVTGAGGSIGSELCRQIIKQSPKKLILFELNEFSLYQIHQELLKNADFQHVELIPLLGSVQRKHRLDIIMRSFKVDTVYHAAAYKHVPLVEYNVVEGIRNNIFGTLYCAQAAIEAGVSTFVLISTDKAVRPTNIMGTTKRMAELILQALAKTQNTTRFCMVRFGNVLGSSGSVVPLFNKQIQEGGPITLTHQKITRFFMTIPEAASLVIQAGAMGKGGDVFVLDMGKPVKIYDLAVRMIHLSGLTLRNEKNPNGDIEISITGLRPGEKLYEELLIGDNVQGTQHPRIMTAIETMLDWNDLNNILQRLDILCSEYKIDEIRDLLISSSTAFSPATENCDMVYQNLSQ
ncbi:nucleoside-diphosphate sugar epimerase [Avibacterium gallinarum]|uniref:FlaA1/EpsC-like NDP-sugar epimerase n=1 Tax=Avibacterium gallinarum TaxID=755 RepID=A0A379AWR5_AVIGA|nr:nucleoside-diphosphate sugar epimerase/dehydratase [Avibacterium gallinarum]POY44470.1 nucleoside-diphosphate sugar epimerase [Avibacterium gallinarum]TDP30246.1 FlaA1/EpsC-like NDP-sugar epimerase [Avibacterium gallinarum]SUB26746.1 putative polysaccharide biosynthesis protein [Avibacterium gallinarum]